MSAGSQGITDDPRREDVLKAWSEQAYPLVLAPDGQSGRHWLRMNAALLPGLRRIGNAIVTPINADRVLRGYQGLLVVVYFDLRPDEDDHPANEHVSRVVSDIADWSGISMWTEHLP